MFVHLFDDKDRFLLEGENLPYVIRLSKRGVKSIYTSKIHDSNHYKVFIKMTLNNGCYMLYNFETIEACNKFHSENWTDLYTSICN